jgi:polysaccharide export outer membrane protein
MGSICRSVPGACGALGAGSAHALCRLSAALLALCACGAAPRSDYTLGPEDAVAIRVVGYEEFSGAGVIRPDGRLSAPGLGEVAASGMTVAKLEAELRGRVARWVRNPIVTVSVTQFRPQGHVLVLGQVAKSGPYPFRSGLTVTEALALAGGPTADADLRKATVIRPDEGQPDHKRQVIDLSPLARKGEEAPHVPLSPGDLLVVPQARQPHANILGEVTKPGEYTLDEEATVLKLVQMAQGPRPGANLKGAILTRGGSTRPLDLEALLQRGDMKLNLTLQDGDTLFIPENRIKVYVLGEVTKSDALLLADGATVLDALTAAGGTTREADLKGVRLGRRSADGTVQVETLDLTRLVDRKKPLPPPAVRDGDMLLVPSRVRKKSATEYLPFLYPVELLSRLLK